jgi:hypothetical protein
MAAFKPVKPERGSIKTEGFYFTSMRFPVEQAKKISRRANAYGLSFSEYVRQAADYSMAADKVEVKGVKADEAIKISAGTTKDYSGKKAAKKAAKPTAKPAAKKAKKVEEEEVEEKPVKKAVKKPAPAASKVVAKKAKKPAPPPDEDEVVESEEEVVDDE